MLLIYILKFFHILCVLGLLGFIMHPIISITTKNSTGITRHTPLKINSLHKYILWLSLLVMLTGTFLVYPKHFTFHTPWVQAAYLLLILFCLGILLLQNQTKNTPHISEDKRFVLLCSYIFLLIVLTCITHDAVTKTTFFRLAS